MSDFVCFDKKHHISSCPKSILINSSSGLVLFDNKNVPINKDLFTIKKSFDETCIDEKCPECKGDILNLSERGQTVCRKCGIVCSDHNPDFSSEGKSPHDKLKAHKFQSTLPYHKYNEYTPSSDIPLINAKKKLQNLSSKFNLPKYLQNEVFEIYEEAKKIDLQKGRSINGILAAIIFYVSKRTPNPLTKLEVIKTANITEKLFNKCYKALINGLSLKPLLVPSSAFLPKFISILNLRYNLNLNSQEMMNIQKKAMQLLLIANNSRGTPRIRAAAAIYHIANMERHTLRLSKRKISDALGLAMTSLILRTKELLKFIDILYPNKMVNFLNIYEII